MLRPLLWTGSCVRLLDQTKLPTQTVYVDITDERQMHDAIRRLVVRGAPAIGMAAAFGIYLGIRTVSDPAEFPGRLKAVCDYLATARPTAVNLFWAIQGIRKLASSSDDLESSKRRILAECLKMIDEDIDVCRGIGEHALRLLTTHIPHRPVRILTHCNAGALATSQYGTALSAIYLGHEQGIAFHVYVDETRPLLQGSRITAFELKENGIPFTLICDNMAATVMNQGMIDAVIVGADRVAANGDVANKIGTLGLAILARHFRIPFYVAAPTSSIDLSLATGAQIPIEQRDSSEVTCVLGIQIAPKEVAAYNPAFDVTPADLVSAIITEYGVSRAPHAASLATLVRKVATRGLENQQKN
jgi:methylthioribose-1-phosphate isomerase